MFLIVNIEVNFTRGNLFSFPKPLKLILILIVHIYIIIISIHHNCNAMHANKKQSWRLKVQLSSNDFKISQKRFYSLQKQ